MQALQLQSNDVSYEMDACAPTYNSCILRRLILD